MKRIIPSVLLLAAFGLFAWQLTACKHSPSPPTEQDAVAVWRNINRSPHYQDLLSLKKTNGQLGKVNGVEVYTLFYQARIRSVVRLGNRPAGTEQTYSSNYPFRLTDEGWLGPDNQVYAAH
jgi:hypothetical protein